MKRIHVDVPAGSVAIGGWRLIGRTPARLFDRESVPPPLLRMGDRIRFVPVAEARS